MNIFVTGASGFIGSRVAEFFSKKKNNVICNYYRRPIKIKNIKKIKLILTKKILIKDNIDTIIHCASKTPINCYKNSIIYNQNIKMMKNLLNFAKKKNVKNFIFLSSISAYGKINKKTLLESDRTLRLDVYGKSKMECEKLLLSFSKKKKNFKHLTIRLPGVVGYGSHGNFISETTKKILNNERIKVKNKSSNFNNIIFVDDVSKFLLTFLIGKKPQYSLVNVASNRKMKILNVINFIYSRLKKKKNIQWSKSKSRPFCIDFSHALRCGFKANSVKNSLKKYTSEYLKNL